MDRQDILKELGFSEQFIQEIREAEKYQTHKMGKNLRYEKINTCVRYYSSEIDL